MSGQVKVFEIIEKEKGDCRPQYPHINTRVHVFLMAEVEVGDADWEGKRCPRIIDISQRDSVNLCLLFS